MPAEPDLTARLRALHDDYVWRVNAAVAEGREDLAQEMSDDYVDEATRVLAEASAGTGRACTRENCPDCAGGRLTAHALSRRPRTVPSEVMRGLALWGRFLRRR
jgi:hypothetical protein